MIRSRNLLAAALIAGVFSVSAQAQNYQAQIGGIVHDSSGAVVPNANIAVTNIATGARASGQSNNQGIYRILALPPAEYKLNISGKGFKSFEQSPITLQVNDAVTLDVSLEVGEATDHVLVTGTAELLQTQTATLGQVVNTRSIESLPLNVRDPLSLIGLTAGVTFGANFGNGGAADIGRNFFKSDFNVGGGRSGSQEILLDGAPNTTADVNRGIINPPVDSVQEFKVQNNSYDAEFGRTSGGIVNVITKSGSNDVHGLAYDFERHSFIEANNWFNNRSRIANPSFKRHQFGGNLGIPVVKNKTFLFADYEGLRQGFPVTFLSTVPTDLQRAGDFSKTFASDGTPIVIYDPNTLVTLANGQRQRSPFLGNIVPSDRIDAVSKKIATYYPAPNQAGDPITGQNNYVKSASSSVNTNKWDIRADQNIGESTRLFGRYSQQVDVRFLPGPLPLPIGGGRNNKDTYHQAILDATHVFSPALIGTAQFAFSRALADQTGLSDGFDITQLGFPASFTAFTVKQFPSGSIADMTGLSNTSDTFTQYQPRNSFTTRAGLAHSRGSHNVKWGLDWRVLDFNESQNLQPAGNFNFTRIFTQGPNPSQASRNGGFGFADFLLGTPNTGSIRQINPISTQGRYYAAFFQDDWRVSNRLTINAGVRWDLSTGNKEKYNRLAYFDPDAPNPLGPRAGLPNLKGILKWIGNENSANQQATQWHNIAPRFGFAYKASERIVVRGGYGIFFVPRIVQGNGNGAIGAFRDTPMVTTIDGGFTPVNRIGNPFPAGSILPPLNDRDPLANTGAAIQAPVQQFKTGYSQLWSLGLQWEVKGMVVQANYWGNKATHLLTGPFNVNQLPNQYLPLGAQLNTQVPNPFVGLIASGALAGQTVSRRQSLLPFPQYSGDAGVQQVFVPAGNANYHAGTLQAEKRLTGALTFLASYTWSKAIDDIGIPQDVYNRRLSKALSAFDAPHQFIGSFVYQIPYGKGRKYPLHGPTNLVLGGWDFDGIVRLQSGQPVALTGASSAGRSGRVDHPTVDRWFDTSAYFITPAFTFNTVGPRLPDVRTDFTRNVDAVLVKNFTASLGDHEILTQFRFETFNVSNTPQFAAPIGAASSQAFGQVTRQFNSPREFQFGLKIKF